GETSAGGARGSLEGSEDRLAGGGDGRQQARQHCGGEDQQALEGKHHAVYVDALCRREVFPRMSEPFGCGEGEQHSSCAARETNQKAFSKLLADEGES